MRHSLLICLLLACCALSAQQWHTTLDIRHAPKRQLPEGVANLIVVNNTVTQPSQYGHSVLRNNVQQYSDSVNLTLASERMLMGAVMQMDYEWGLQSVGAEPVSQNSSTDFYSQQTPTAEQAALWIQQFAADAALSLDRLILYDKEDCYLTIDGDYYAWFKAYLASRWTTYTQDGKKQSYVFTDTLFWEGRSDSPTAALQQLPDKQTALLDFAEYAGSRFADSFLETWQTVDRYFYENKNENIKKGMQALTRRQWQQAIAEWETAYRSSDKETRAYAAADIAVAEEIQDNLESALKWATKAQNEFLKLRGSDYAQQAVNLACYTRLLEKRIKENK